MHEHRSVRVEPGGVAETLLWTLSHRAAEARRPDTVLADPIAVELVDTIEFPFAERFGEATPARAQWQALRAKCFDRAARRFLAAHPGATVVALGEGLETQRVRVDDGRMRWVSVDMPVVIALRRRFLPEAARTQLVESSVTDHGWLDAIDTSAPVLVTAQGLLMYLAPAEVHALLAAVAERIPQGAIVFDAVSRRLSERSMRGGVGAPGSYQPPPWTWGIDRRERRAIAAIPNLSRLHRLALPRGRGAAFGVAVPIVSRLPPLRDALLSIWTARLGAA
jgi:O-methyltransferase involved in polyketide biosynthesis